MSIFHLKQFDIRQEQSALKVGTDGMLLAAWVAHRFREAQPTRILDVGTGTGVIALMLAQELRESAVVGVELDELSTEEAIYNVAHSPFATRVTITSADYCHYYADEPFQLIVSNPPYFTPTHTNANQRETIAKHSIGLLPQAFFESSQRVLTPFGSIAIIISHSALHSFVRAASEHSFYISERVDVVTKAGKAPQRHILTLSREKQSIQQSTLTILCGDGRHDYTEEYATLLRPFLIIL